MLDQIASKSKDPNTKVGCIIVDQDHIIQSTGYNSFPRGLKDNVPERLIRPEKYSWIEHAERNAIYQAARNGKSLRNCRIYLPFFPCLDCARGIIQSGIKEIILNEKTYVERLKNTDTIYNTEIGKVAIMLDECDVAISTWDLKTEKLEWL